MNKEGLLFVHGRNSHNTQGTQLSFDRSYVTFKLTAGCKGQGSTVVWHTVKFQNSFPSTLLISTSREQLYNIYTYTCVYIDIKPGG